MSLFTELLNQALPSTMYEDVDDIDTIDEIPETEPETDDLDFSDPDDINDDDDEITPVADTITNGPSQMSPESEERIDNVINVAATNIIISDDMSEEEYHEFVESTDSDIMINEGFITERTIVKFDKNARKAQLFEVAWAACAREAKDPLYKKLLTLYKMERIIKAKLRIKYRNMANRKVKEYLKRAGKSKSGILARIAAKFQKR